MKEIIKSLKIFGRVWLYRIFNDKRYDSKNLIYKIFLGTNNHTTVYIETDDHSELLKKAKIIGNYHTHTPKYYSFKNVIFSQSFNSIVVTYKGEDSWEENEYVKEILPYITLKSKDDVCEIHTLERSSTGYYSKLNSFNKMDSFDISNYSFDAKKLTVDIKPHLEKSGIILFRGKPGTGKTSFIKHLIEIYKDKKFLYVPPNMANSISSPEFIGNLRNLKDFILIIEDGENVISKRNQGPNQAVSNLLNLSNGLLGDIFNTPIIITVNTEFSNIDEALLRPGRLKIKQEFDLLKGKSIAEKTNVVVNKISKKRIGFIQNT